MNPFEKRATEYIRDDLAFLPYVTPEPLLTYLERYAKEDVLFDRLVVLIGAPGSGKTTLARLFLLPTLTTLLRNANFPSQPSLADALTLCRAISPEKLPLVGGCRIPLESDYRDCWELPYSESIRHTLFFSLLQARTVLAWLRGLEESGNSLDNVRLIPRADAAAALETIGGESLINIREVARSIERDVYRVTAGLLPPPQDQLPVGAATAYRPFDVIEAFEIPTTVGRARIKPLVICDDAHVLHAKQLEGLIQWLARREIRVSRWILTRIDALRPQDVLRPQDGSIDGQSGLNRARDMVSVWMQTGGDRRSNRQAFRRIAKDMSSRYLRQMPIFIRRGLSNLEELLDTQVPVLPEGKLRDLEKSLVTGTRRFIGPQRRAEIEQLVDSYLTSDSRLSEPRESREVRAMMIRILMERYVRRVPQNSLFEESLEPAPTLPLKADSTVRNAAEMQLNQEFNRPFFYGFNTLCDAASENAEKFLRLAGYLVAQLETQLIRNGASTLTAVVQDRLLRERASRMTDEEDFPERARVIKVCEGISTECLTVTREPNASLGEGPNAWGIRQTEFDTIGLTQPLLARVLQSGVAYNMFSLIRNHGTKGELWCLVELSGVWSLKRGLTLKRGQFLERRVEDLLKLLNSPGETP